jgi:hypothetical protein
MRNSLGACTSEPLRGTSSRGSRGALLLGTLDHIANGTDCSEEQYWRWRHRQSLRRYRPLSRCLRHRPFIGLLSVCEHKLQLARKQRTVTGWSQSASKLITARPCTENRCVRPPIRMHKATVRSRDALACVLPSRLKRGASNGSISGVVVYLRWQVARARHQRCRPQERQDY